MTNLLAEVCPVDDLDVENNKAKFPLDDDHWLNSPYGQDQKWLTLLEMAIKEGKMDFIKLLLAAGASASKYNDKLGQCPLHLAVQDQQLEICKVLMDFMAKKPKVNKAKISVVNRAGWTALHMACDIGNYEIAEYLISHPDLECIDPKDLDGATPLYYAAKNSHEQVCKLLISYNASINIKSYGKSVKDLIATHMPKLDVTKVAIVDKSKSKWDPCEHLNFLLDEAERNLMKGRKNTSNFLEFKIYVKILGTGELESYEDCGLKLVQKACKSGLDEHLQCLLDKGLDPNGVTHETPMQPVLIASYYGFHKVLQVLVDSGNPVNFAESSQDSKETVLHNLLRRPLSSGFKHPHSNYDLALEVLLSSTNPAIMDQVNGIINHKDGENMTPFHYATQQWSQPIVRQLLERGANVGVKNNWDEVPITMIMPETMENFLDEFCLQSKNEVTHNDFELEFNYSFLAPPVNDHKLDKTDNEGHKIVESQALPETDGLWHMAQSKKHRHLLKHPVVTSFLWLKWHRIRGYFNKNLRFYLLLVVCLSWYVFERFGGVSARVTVLEDQNKPFCASLNMRKDEGIGFWYGIFIAHAILQLILILRDWTQDCDDCSKHATFQMGLTSWLEALTVCLIVALLYARTQLLWLALTILFALLMLREVVQMLASLKRYLLSPENWLEMSMLVLAIIILWVPDDNFSDPCTVKRHLAAICIILSWAELITLVARHPKLAIYNIYVTMFYKVFETFFFFLLWYSFFIIAFGFGFYIMLHQDVPGTIVKEDDYIFFNSSWLSLVKTATMFVGEIEFSDIPVDMQSGMSFFSYLFLLSFIFLIVVVLMNLLNGLAVSDTGLIREKAEIVSAITRVEAISYVESLLLGDPFDFLSNWPPFKWVRKAPSLALFRSMNRNKRVKDISMKITGATGLLLFYSMLPNKTLTLFPNKKKNLGCFSRNKMSEEVIDSAKAIIVRKNEERRREGQKNQKEEIAELKKLIQSLHVKLENLVDNKKLDVNK